MKDDQADLAQLMPAPDFVGGGSILYDAAEMQNVLEKGRGSIRVRAQWAYDKENNCIDITRIPPTTTVEAIMDKITELAKKGRVLVGASRKRIVKKLVGEKSAVGKSIGGNVAIAVWAAMNGASVVRVHDVKETMQALRVIERLRG